MMSALYYEIHVTVLPVEGADAVDKLRKALPSGWKVAELQMRQGVGVVDMATSRAHTREAAEVTMATGCYKLIQAGYRVVRAKIEGVVFDTRLGHTLQLWNEKLQCYEPYEVPNA
jgi:hypothetical protein